MSEKSLVADPRARVQKTRFPGPHRRLWAAALVLLATAGCTGDPPTVVPVPTGAAAEPGKQVVEMTIPPPQAKPVKQITAAPIAIDEVTHYRDVEGKFSIDVPAGWTEKRQTPSQQSSDVKLGTIFLAPEGNGMLSITHFDNGKKPQVIGPIANSVLKLAGWPQERGYEEISRENVMERPKDALRIQLRYIRQDGVPMHSLVLFQVDNTNFSMVHVGIAESSWIDNEAKVRNILRSYRMPAGLAVPAATGAPASK